VEHPDEEALALLALGEDSAEGGPHAGHLDSCDHCRAEVAALRRVAEIGVQTQEVRDLPPPPNAVWDRIAAATEAAPSTVDSTVSARPRPRWTLVAAAAVAALVVGVAGTLVVTRDRERPAPVACGTVVARADLAALPLAPTGATGEARVLCDGPDRRLHLHVSGLPRPVGYYEVWLIDPDSMEMTAVGQLGDGADVLLPLPSTADLQRFRLVDISAEQYDNNQTHSGKSLLQGQLTP
jgi:hypothetical protein